MGRPTLKDEEKKVRKSVFIAPKTYQVLKEKAALYLDGNIGKYLSLVLDEAILHHNIQSKPFSLVYKNDLYASIRELNKIGNNINQLTKLAHQDRILESDLRLKLERLEKEIKELNLKIGALLSK